MKQIKLFYIFIFIITASVFSCLLPYPIFSNLTNITEKNMVEIGNYHETEIIKEENHSPKILDLDWFSSINNLLNYNTPYEIIDLQSTQPFEVVRIGGKNHADVVPSNLHDLKIMHEIASHNWNKTRRPVLLKINDNTFLACSIVLYPHGYSNTQNIENGHFCLHFKGSKMHGTNQEDSEHQRAIKKAYQSKII